MALGATRTYAPPAAAQNLAIPAPTPPSSGGRGSAARLAGADQGAATFTPWVLIALLGLWVLWAVVEQHQKVKSAVQPKNIAINLRNLAAIVIPVILALALLRIAVVKLQLVISWALGQYGWIWLQWAYDLNGALIRIVA